MREFQTQIGRINNDLSVIADIVEVKLPAVERSLMSEMAKKAGSKEIEEMGDRKADKEIIDKLVERLNKIEE